MMKLLRPLLKRADAVIDAVLLEVRTARKGSYTKVGFALACGSFAVASSKNRPHNTAPRNCTLAGMQREAGSSATA
jgi:hypothetical protein